MSGATKIENGNENHKVKLSHKCVDSSRHRYRVYSWILARMVNLFAVCIEIS